MSSTFSASSASIVEVENFVSCTACEPKTTTPTRSEGAFEATKLRAALPASVIFWPAIERERSTATTTLLAEARF